MRMGTDGCSGEQGTRATQKQGKQGTFRVSQGRIWGHMAGEISPDIMFCEGRQKVTQMDAAGCRSVRMGADECINKDGSKNKAKRAPNG